MTNKPHLNNKNLKIVRNNSDWRKLWDVLGIVKDSKKSKDHDWWGKSPLNPGEQEASFHMNDRGWYCHSAKEGGVNIELVQAYFRHRHGQNMNCYDAGRWLIENNVSHLTDSPRSEQVKPEMPEKPRSEEKKEILENKPIRQNLIPALSLQGEHEQFKKRGISKATCEYLGCGYLAKATGEMKERIIFQIGGVVKEGDSLKPVILSHTGRATTKEQEEKGRWNYYSGFKKKIELYNQDKVLLDPEAIDQAKKSGQVIIVEGCFDVAKLIEAGIKNTLATFGSCLYEEQKPRLNLIKEHLGDVEFLVWYDRDRAGREGQEGALKMLEEGGYKAKGFDWEISFQSKARENIKIPEEVTDPCKLSVEQIRFLRDRGFI